MKSKISFFNKTIFMKNVTLYWPIWGIYTLISLVMQSGVVWLCNNMSYFGNGYSDEEQFRDLMGALHFEGYVVLIAFGALIAGMALYSYLYNSKSANMIHSLPVDRTQLYGTTLISGWAFLIAPLFVTALLTSLFCLIYTIPGIGYVWLWFLSTTGLAVIAFSIVTICALFTGHIVVLPMYVTAVNLLSWLVYYLVNTVITTFGFGVYELGSNAEFITGVFCPIQCFVENLNWVYDYSDTGKLKGVSLSGEMYLVLYLVLAVVFYVSAYVIYRKRKIEQAGDFLTVNWIKPIFRGVVTVFGAIYGAMIVRSILLDTSLGCGMLAFVIIMLVCGVVFYFAADMFIKKSFHVFKKRNWIGCAVASVIVLISFFGMYGMADQYEKDVPNLEDIEYAEIRSGYDIALYGEQVEAVLEIQKAILEKADYIEARLAAGERYYNIVTIRYKQTNGEWIYRRYPLLQEDANLKEIEDKIAVLEQDEENYLVTTFGKDYANITTFYGGNLKAYFIDPENRNDAAGVIPEPMYETRKLNEVQAKEMYYAILADIKAGTLMKYNVYDSKYLYDEGVDVDYNGLTQCISIEYEFPAEVVASENAALPAGAYPVDDEYVQKYNHVYLNFGPDCENIINKLVELGIIESVEHLWWGSAEGLMK